MSLRNMFQGSIVKPGFNPLAAPISTTYYTLNTWGFGSTGRLGLGNTTTYSSPKQVGGTTDGWSVVESGYRHGLSIKNNGTLWAWGSNNVGQLGLGNVTNYSSPKQIGSLTNWLKVSGGFYYSTAIKTDGTLWTWGNAAQGVLGLGNATSYSSPKQVGALTNWLKIAAGFYHVGAIKTDGTLWMWGQNNKGQLGLGNITNYSSPKQVGALTNWLQVSAGWYITAAIKTDGTLWTWGKGLTYGALGLGNKTDYSSPKQVGALTNWLSVSAGLYVMTAVKTDGTLWTWGFNNVGQLGIGNTTYYSSPKQVGALTTWAKPGTGGASYNARFAIKTDGTLWAWGSGQNGQLGLGNTTYYSSPKQVGSLTSWLSVSSGQYWAAALN